MKTNKFLDFKVIVMFGYNNWIVQDDLRLMAGALTQWDNLKDKTILVTGATGMLATYITYLLCYLHKERNYNLRVIALCRTKSKAENLFHPFLKETWFLLLCQDICAPIDTLTSVDYIFHLASNASPYFIKNDPVGIIKSNLLGTYNIAEFARRNKLQRIVFASTREVYGKNEDIPMLAEDNYGIVNPLENRACYPESKRAAETLLHSYWLQYQIPSCIVRIAHCYGPGMKLRDDGRVMADLLSNVIEGEDIVLNSDGSAERAFCYITDAVVAMFLVLFSGENGKAYNVANETEPISIKELAELLVSLNKDKRLKVVFRMQETTSGLYCNYRRSGLNTTELEKLGWYPEICLQDGLIRTINSITQS